MLKRNIVPVYRVLEQPAALHGIGITSALNRSSCTGSKGGMMLKPSAAPSLNQSSIRSAICSGVPAATKWPRAPAR